MTAIIESDWISMSFTMHWKFTSANSPVRFDLHEPLFQAIPIATNVCRDLEAADVAYMQITDDPELDNAYRTWNSNRQIFHRQKAVGEVKPDGWQKDYFSGNAGPQFDVVPGHMTKLVPPNVRARNI
jgi:hypothetical protein